MAHGDEKNSYRMVISDWIKGADGRWWFVIAGE